MKENIKEKTFEPVRIGYNERGCSDKLYKLKNSIQKLDEFRIRFENLGLGWNTDTLMDFLLNGALNSENNILKMISQEVERCIFPGRREALEKELNDTIYHDFKQLAADLKRAKPDCEPKYLEFIGGSVTLSAEGKKSIEDSFILYANSPDELEIWKEATELVERLKKLDDRLKPFGVYAIAEWDVNSPALIRLSTSTPEANPFTIEECNPNGLWSGRR